MLVYLIYASLIYASLPSSCQKLIYASLPSSCQKRHTIARYNSHINFNRRTLQFCNDVNIF